MNLDEMIKSLCSFQINQTRIDEIITELANFPSHGFSETHIAQMITKILPDCSSETSFQVLSSTKYFLSPTAHEKVLGQCQNLIASHPKRCTLIKGKASNASSFSDLMQLLKMAENVSEIDDILKTCNSVFTESIDPTDVERLLSLSSCNEKIINSMTQNMTNYDGIFQTAILLLMFNEPVPKNYDLWKVCDFESQGLIGVSMGKLLSRLGLNHVEKAVFFLLSFIESSTYQNSFAIFFACFVASLPTFTRSEIISELLILASDSEDDKYIQYLNMILDGTNAGINLNLADFKAALDFVDLIPPSMILSYYSILVKIALKMSNVSNLQALNELCLIIRKQLASPLEHICFDGVAGTLALLSSKIEIGHSDTFDFQFASCSQPNKSRSSASGVNLAIQQEFMFLAYTACAKFASSCRLFYQDMSRLVESETLSSELMEKLSDKVAEDFQKSIITEAEDDIPEDAEIKYNLMEDEELIVVRTYPLITQTSMGHRISRLNLVIRLLGSLEKKLNGGNLENIDAILKFPIVMPPRNTDTNLVFACYLTACNYIRELISTFSDQTELTMQENCFKRLAHLTEIEGQIQELTGKSISIACLQDGFSGPYIDSSLIKSNAQNYSVSSSAAHELMEKAASYSHDRKISAIDQKLGLRVKSDEGIHRLYQPLPISVLSWIERGIGESDKTRMLTEEEFFILLNELRLQMKGGSNDLEDLLKILDKANSIYMSSQEEFDEDSDLLLSYPKLMLELVPILRAHQQLTPQRISIISAICSADDEQIDINGLKLKILLCKSEADEKTIIQAIKNLVESSEIDSTTLDSIITDIKHFRTSFKSLFESFKTLENDSNKVKLLKLRLELLSQEAGKSNCLDSDLWLMEELEELTQAAKSSYNTECMDCLLKVARDSIDSIITHVMPRLEHFLLEHKDEVLSILKKFQQFTRSIQTICNHVKSAKEKSLLKRVPLLKKSLETSLMRVKQMLETNQCHSAFWVGNLKHKSLDGKEVSAQISLKREEMDEAESDEERVEEDLDEDMETASEADIDPTLGLSL